MAIKAHFLAPWRNTPETHVATFARQLDMRQIDCEYHRVTITNNNKVDYFVEQVYACGLSEAKFMYNWEETADKSWGATPPPLHTSVKQGEAQNRAQEVQEAL